MTLVEDSFAEKQAPRSSIFAIRALALVSHILLMRAPANKNEQTRADKTKSGAHTPPIGVNERKITSSWRRLTTPSARSPPRTNYEVKSAVKTRN